MLMRQLMALVITVLLFSGAAAQDIFAKSSSSSLLPAQPEFLPVDQAYQLSVAAEPGALQLSWLIAPGYYLYKHRLGVEIAGKNLTESLQLPPGIARTDEYFGAVEVYYQTLDISLPLSLEGEQVLTVQSQGCADAGLCYPPRTQRFKLNPGTSSIQELTAADAASPLPEATTEPLAAATTSLSLALILAFCGGLILNLMPCVLPVLTLKALSFANSPSNAHQRAHGWAYSAGVVLSFVLIAALLIALKAAGQAIGWGFQLQSPWVIALLIYLFFILGLNLLGLFSTGTQLMGAGQSLTEKSGLSGSFFTGVLATTVASPCTAPFMGTALGFAFTQSWPVALGVFVALGAGMAFPFLLLSYLPGLQRLLPKPGAWMERFKELMAFPLFATAIWLISVLNSQTGSTGVTLILSGCLLIALSTWVRTNSTGAKVMRHGLQLAAIALLLQPGITHPGSAATNPQNAYSEAAVLQLQSQGKPVFVDVTADWCITCKVNERVALHKPEVQAAFKQADVTYLVADWTRYDPVISALVARHGRGGIPLYLMYPGQPGAQPQLLPQLLTPAIVLAAIESVSK